MLNKGIATLRDNLIQQWRDAPGGISPTRAALTDDFESSGRLQTLALAYGVGAQAAAVAGGNAEVGTLCAPRCYGCY